LLAASARGKFIYHAQMLRVIDWLLREMKEKLCMERRSAKYGTEVCDYPTVK
jgi:hypothetical protein